MKENILDICPLSGEKINCSVQFIGTEQYKSEWTYMYEVSVNGRKLRFMLPPEAAEWKNNPFYANNKHIIWGLTQNGFINFPDESYLGISLTSIKKYLEEFSYPKTIKEKYNNLFLELCKKQNFDGEVIVLGQYYQKDFYKFYFKTGKEMTYYLETLANDGLIRIFSRGLFINSIQLTFQGLTYASKLEEEGIKSKKCFIAMSFGKNMTEIRSAIKEALIKTKFQPILVDEIHFESHSTINDAIIANLRKSRFCIADFTEQKDGVYFESGFALGQGKQVIYTCHEDDFDRSHFDLNHFPHIIYTTPHELTQKLINKIEAWIS